MSQFIIPYLTFPDPQETADYYKDVFDGEITYIMYGKDTPNCPEDQLEDIMHLELKIQGTYVYMSIGDAKPTAQNMLMLDFENLDDLQKAYDNMLKESKEITKLADSFWGAKWGLLEDKFGMQWGFHFSKKNGN